MEGKIQRENSRTEGNRERREIERVSMHACKQERLEKKASQKERKKRKEKKESVCLLTLNAFYPIATHIVEPRRGRVYRRIAGV